MNDVIERERDQYWQNSSARTRISKQKRTIKKSRTTNSKQEQQPTNWTPYIICGVGIVVVIIGLVWLVNRNKEDKI